MKADDVRRIVKLIHGTSSGPPIPIAGGWSGTQIWRVELEGGPHLLRIFASGEDVVATREAAALEHGTRNGLPVARVVARDNVDGRAVLLLEWIEGRELREALATEPLRAEEYGVQFGRLQACLHQLDPPPNLPQARDWPVRNAYPEHLRALIHDLPAISDRLLHLDFHPLNVLVEDGSISGLIDWTNVSRGDPRFDLARTWLILRLLPGLDAAMKARFRPVARAFMRGWHRGYRAERGPIDGIVPFLAWAGYGLLYDLGRKPASLLDDDAASDLAALLEELKRDTSRWMAMVGL